MEQIRYVDDAITARHSVRAFLDTPVATETIKDILNVAARAPSGTNTQPWKVYVVTGQKRAEMIERVCAAQQALFQQPELAEQYQETFAYYPETWISPFIDRRRENGWGLYGLLGIQKGEKEKWRRNNCVTINCLMRLSHFILQSIKQWELVQKWIFP
jgi:nitroreductase